MAEPASLSRNAVSALLNVATKKASTMNFANRINQLLAASIGVVNALLAIFLILIMVAGSISLFGTGVGIVVGLLGGAALAVAICGALALLVNIRDLLEESLRRRT